MARQRAISAGAPLCHLITRSAGDVTAETILFPGAIFTFEVEGEEDEEVRVGDCVMGLTPEQADTVRAMLEDECTHINACDCPEHEGLEAEFIAYL